jgi:hypothetical protein
MATEKRTLAWTRQALSTASARARREPLVHFFAVALVLFAANRLIHGPVQQAPGDVITISQGRVQQIADSYRLLAGRRPSRAELQALVQDFIDEEIDYREAIAMGLDADDTIVRRRMRQKLEFLVEDAEASEEPSDAQLTTWRASHAADYRLPARISFRHVLANADTRGDRARADAAGFLRELRAGAAPEKLGDASMLPAALPLTSEKGIATLFGDSFAANVFAHSGSGWFGPVISPLGAHDVLILAREPARDPNLAELRDKLRSDWIEAQRLARRNAFQARLRQRYAVQVDWPQPYAAQNMSGE